MGDFKARVGKACLPDDVIGLYGEDKKNTDGVERLKFLENTEMKVLIPISRNFFHSPYLQSVSKASLTSRKKLYVFSRASLLP